MYKIPENYDFSVLKGEFINQIAFGLNTICIFFNKGFIQFTGSFSFRHLGKQFNYDEVYPVENDFRLLQILEKEITGITLANNREELKIEFEGETMLILIGDEMYESIIININGNEVIV
jgi:hypothetical protein